MQFTIRNNIANYEFMQFNTIMDATSIILHHILTPGEEKLNRYLQENYDTTLKAACLHLVKHCKMYKNLSDEITIIFPNKTDDKLASLITYGNDEVQGSNLLKNAFFRD